MVLRGRKINNFVELRQLSGFRRVGHLSFMNQFSKKLASTASHRKSAKFSKKNDFDDPFHRNGPVLAILVWKSFSARDDQTIRMSIFLIK